MTNDESTVTPQRVQLGEWANLVQFTYPELAAYLRQLADQLERTEANEFNAIWVINKHLAGTDEVSTFNDAMEIVRKAGRQLERNAEVQWQPIETAPKDGTSILAWGKSMEEPVVAYWEPNGDRVWGGKSAFVDGTVDMCEELCVVDDYTHWQPLPKPPEAK